MRAQTGVHFSVAYGRRAVWATALVALCLALAACGFRLKGTTPLPFQTLYTNIAENSAFGAALRRAIRASSPGTRFVGDPAQADARLMQLANRQQRRELSIDASGHVEEYELTLEFVFQVLDREGRVILPPTTLRASRDMPYDPDDAQAKSGEMRMIFEDMQDAMVARVVRRLSAPDVADAYEQAQSAPPPDIIDESPETGPQPLHELPDTDDPFWLDGGPG